VLFLTAMGVGLGSYVDRSGGAALGGLTYLQFLAPGLLAATAMQAAAFEATFPIINGLVLLGIPVAVLTGMAFATPIAAFAATQRTPARFNIIFRFGVMPLFLFSGTFFPIESLPGFLQPIAWLSPLWHGVDLARGLVLGTIAQHPAVMLAHVVILVAIVAAGTWATVRNVERRLVQG
jgi:lipooligosaccharide transport system permease protein